MARTLLCNIRFGKTHTRQEDPRQTTRSSFTRCIFKLSRFEVYGKRKLNYFLKICIYATISCSHYAVSNASTKVTKKSKHPNNYQNIITNSKATFTCASPWHKYHLHLPPNIKINNYGTLRLLTQRR